MDWDDLRYVLAISRERTLSGAAKSLGVTRTTVGRRVCAIEENLGVRLFDRTPDGFMPTPAGQDIEAVAERMESDVLSVEGRVLGRDVQLHGKLRVSTLDVLFLLMQDAFSSFLARYPSIDLTVSATLDEVSLSRREADVVLRLSNAPPEYLVGRKVGRVEVAVYGSTELVERAGPDATYDDFPWLCYDDGMRSSDPWMTKHAPNARIAMRADTPMVMRHAIAAGIGVQFMSCVDGDANPRVARIGPIVPENARDLWLLTHPDLRNTSRVRAFMEHMHVALREQLSATET